MRTHLRFSAAVAFSRDRRQRWRQICVITSSIIATFAVLVSASLVSLALASPARAGAMLGVPTAAIGDGEPGISPRGAAAAMVDRATLAMGRQVPTVWIEPMPGHDHDPAAIPPGLDHLPAPGEAVLSPALVSAGYTAEDFGWHGSNAGAGAHGVIGEDGLVTPSEPLIFVRPRAGSTLGTGGAITYVATFARADPSAVNGGRSYDPDIVSASMMEPGVVAFLVIPSLVLLISSSRARSAVRDERLRFLHLLGVRGLTARAAMGSETGLLALTGAMIAVLAFALIGPWLTVIPATSIRLFPGDLSVPWSVHLAAVSLTVGVGFICGSLGRLTPRRRRGRSRTAHTAAVIALVLAVVTVIVSASPWAPTPWAATIFTLATLAVIITLPLAVPALSAMTATVLIGARSPVIWAAARRIRHDAVHLSRVASVLSVLIVVVSFAVALWGSANATQHESAAPRGEGALTVGWRGDPTAGLAAARRAFADDGRAVLIVPFLSQDDSKGEMPHLIGIDDCPEFVQFFGGNPTSLCAPGAQRALADFSEAHTGLRPPDASTTLIADGVGGDAVVFSHTPLSVQDTQRLLGFLPALTIDLQSSDITAPLPIVQWLTAGALSAFVILSLAIVREIGDRSVDDAGRDLLYQRLGLSLRTSSLLAWSVLLIPLIVATVTAFICSVVISYSGELLTITQGDSTKLVIVALTSLALPIGTILLTVPARRATSAAHRR